MSEFHLTEDQQDCLQELINVAMGQASDQLARYLDTFVYLKVPSIESVDGKGADFNLEPTAKYHGCGQPRLLWL